jgi:dTDP-4-amino-4,6-dideoxygalactose transaminase
LDAAYTPKTKVLAVSHLHGGIVPMREVMSWAGAHHVRVIEDAAQSPGSMTEGKKAGTWGDVGILSFGGSKLLTAGRGGALLTRNPMIHQRARRHMMRGNLVYPLSELQAAVLLPQLDKLDRRNRQRSQAVSMLKELVSDIPGLKPFSNECRESCPGYYKLGFQFDAERFGLARDLLVLAMRAEGIAIDPGFRGLHVGRSAKRFRQAGSLRETERAHQGAVILHHPVLLGSRAEVGQVARAFHKIYANADRLAQAADHNLFQTSDGKDQEQDAD